VESLTTKLSMNSRMPLLMNMQTDTIDYNACFKINTQFMTL